MQTTERVRRERSWSLNIAPCSVAGASRRQYRPNGTTDVDRWSCSPLPLVTLGSVPPGSATLGLRRPATAAGRSPLGRLSAGLNARGLAGSLVLRPSLLGQPAAGFASAGRSGSEAARRSDPPRVLDLSSLPGRNRNRTGNSSRYGTKLGTQIDPTRCRHSCLPNTSIRRSTSHFPSACVCYRWRRTLSKSAVHTRAQETRR